MKLEFFDKLWNIHRVNASFYLFSGINPKFAEILKYFAQSLDCKIAAFINSGNNSPQGFISDHAHKK